MKQTLRTTTLGLLATILCVATSAVGAEKSIVVLGDSIAAGYGVDAEEAFPAVLQTFVEKEGLPFTVVNAGVSGDTTAGGARRIAWLAKRPMDVLVIELGGNDGLRGIPPETTRANLETIIARAREANPEIQIVLAGMQIFQNMGADYAEEFKKTFDEVAAEQGVALIPFLLEGVGGVAELNQDDQIHPNPKGHQRVAENVWAVLKPLLVKLAPTDS